VIKMSEKFIGKIVYQPPEKCFSNHILEKTEHGWKVYRSKGDTRPVAFIPHSAVKSVEWKG
jgi:hypothetical protein